MYRVYRAAAWQPVDQIRYNTMFPSVCAALSANKVWAVLNTDGRKYNR
jgi:hypothetical protein